MAKATVSNLRGKANHGWWRTLTLSRNRPTRKNLRRFSTLELSRSRRQGMSTDRFATVRLSTRQPAGVYGNAGTPLATGSGTPTSDRASRFAMPRRPKPPTRGARAEPPALARMARGPLRAKVELLGVSGVAPGQELAQVGREGRDLLLQQRPGVAFPSRFAREFQIRITRPAFVSITHADDGRVVHDERLRVRRPDDCAPTHQAARRGRHSGRSHESSMRVHGSPSPQLAG